jgi:hypothetical protein
VPAFVSAADVRGYLELNSSASTSKYTDGAISSNIQAASTFLERATGRWFAERLATTYVATSQGATALAIPGLRSATTVTQQSTTLVADESYHLIPDTMQTGLYTAIQFRGFGSRSYSHGYLSNPEWFDRNLDREWARGWDWRYSLPNDVSITGDWGYAAANLPEALLHATKVLAAFYTKRPDSVLASVATTVEGTTLDYSVLPPEVQTFIDNWKLGGAQVVAVG